MDWKHALTSAMRGRKRRASQRDDLLGSLLHGQAVEAIVKMVPGHRMVDIVMYETSLNSHNKKSGTIEMSVGTEYTFPLGTYRLHVLVERVDAR